MSDAEIIDLGLGNDPRQWAWRLYTKMEWKDKFPASYVRLSAIQDLLREIMVSYTGEARDAMVRAALDQTVQRVRKVQVLPEGRAVYFETADDYGDYGYTVTFPELQHVRDPNPS